jgi:hypothetical protein
MAEAAKAMKERLEDSPFAMPELECRNCGRPWPEQAHVYCDPWAEWLRLFLRRLFCEKTGE